MLDVPAHRYIRVRLLQGIPLMSLVPEIQRLQLLAAMPLTALISEVKNLQDNLPQPKPKKGRRTPGADAVERGPLRLVIDNTKTSSPKRKPGRPKKDKAARHPFLDPRPDSALTVAQYASKYGISSYLTEAGHEKLLNALDIWSHAAARDVVCGMLSVNADTSVILAFLRKADKKENTFKHIRATDIEAFHALFWDFSSFSLRQKLEWLGKSDTTLHAYAAVTEGFESMLWRMGVDGMQLNRVQMYRNAQYAAYARIVQERYHPGSVSASDLHKLTVTMSVAGAEIDKLDTSGEVNLREQLMGTSVEALEAEFPPSLNDIIRENEAQQLLDHMEVAVGRGELSKQEFDSLRSSLLGGEDIEGKLSTSIVRRAASVTSLGLDQKSVVDEDIEQDSYEDFVFERSRNKTEK